MESEKKRIGALILAAGESSRFGSPKALAKFGQETALERLIRVGCDVGCDPVVVVTGAEGDLVEKGVGLAREKAKFVRNQRYSEGQLSSIQIGLSVFPPSTEAFALFLVDHPMVKIDTVRNLLKQFHGLKNRILRPVSENRGGHPTIFPMSLKEEIINLDPKTSSMRDVLYRDHKTLDVIVYDQSVVAGFNTQEEYRKLLKEYSGDLK